MEKQRRQDLTKKTLKLSVLLFLPISVFSALCFILLRCFTSGDLAVSILAVMLNAFVAATGFAAIFVSVQTDKNIKRYEFVEDYNFHFLTSDKFFDVERKLESCYQKYEELEKACGPEEKWGKEQEVAFKKYCDKVFGTIDYKFVDENDAPNSRKDKGSECISKEYQKIINYLVYLESFVPLLQNKQLLYEDVDDLFGYRYFIAVNNPVLQENELFIEKDFYRGCIGIYKDWKDHRENKAHVKIPLSAYDLEKRMSSFLARK